MEKGLNLEVIWEDQDCIEVLVTCFNGRFSGVSRMYLSHNSLPRLAGAVGGFPTGVSDSRRFELGTFDAKFASGGIKIYFCRSDALGHAILDVQLRGENCKALGEVESVALRIPIEPAGVDSFVLELTATGSTVSASAGLPMAT